MAKTSGDELFERYLRENGYDPGPHEPSLKEHGIAKRPDFLPTRDGIRAACEVEQFTAGETALEKRLNAQGYVAASPQEVYGPIRNHVASAAKQLKPLQVLELPLVVVLANPEGASIDLLVTHVLAALYGDPTYTLPINTRTGGSVGEGRLEFGRGGKLTNTHPYLSAVALLRRREHKVDRIEEIAAENAGRPSPSDFDNATAQAVELLDRLKQESLPEGDYLYIDVIDTMSNSAVPLPDDWFSSDHDSRWRLNTHGYFELVRGPDRS
jgi:hypothetical protein